MPCRAYSAAAGSAAFAWVATMPMEASRKKDMHAWKPADLVTALEAASETVFIVACPALRIFGFASRTHLETPAKRRCTLPWAHVDASCDDSSVAVQDSS